MSPSRRNSSWAITRENVLETLNRAGGSLESRLVIGHFMAGIKDEKMGNKSSLQNLSGILESVATLTNDSECKKIWRLKREYIA